MLFGRKTILKGSERSRDVLYSNSMMQLALVILWQHLCIIQKVKKNYWQRVKNSDYFKQYGVTLKHEMSAFSFYTNPINWFRHFIPGQHWATVEAMDPTQRVALPTNRIVPLNFLGMCNVPCGGIRSQGDSWNHVDMGREVLLLKFFWLYRRHVDLQPERLTICVNGLYLAMTLPARLCSWHLILATIDLISTNAPTWSFKQRTHSCKWDKDFV